VRIATDGVVLQADLVVLEDAMGIVAFAHGSGSGRFSPRNRFVASTLNEAGLGTLLADLLTTSEERVDARTAALRFDIDLLTRRLIGIVDWLSADDATQGLPIGLFGASTGAAAAVRAGAARPGLVKAVVSRGGRVDLAEDGLPRCTAPTLLIVGGDDREVLALNRQALDHSSATTKQLVVVAGATHLFEERGALEQVARSAATWFLEHLGATAPTAATRQRG
jgi:putative phosphoribosyl transferase